MIPDDAEYAVTVSFVLREDTLWAEAGHEVAFGQKVYKKEVKSAVPENITGSPRKSQYWRER